jgi:2-hydroxychromene-2-carboxylate isomerase
MLQDVDFFSDFVSPYAYLALTQFAALTERKRHFPLHLHRQ